MNDAVLIERRTTRIAVVTLNRPGARNAVDAAVTAGLANALATTEADPDIWAVVVTGAGEQAFCAGADLKVIAAGQSDSLRTAAGGFAGFVFAEREKPWIAAVNGLALAGGFEIALACDLIVATENAAFALPEVKRGLIASAGGAFRLPRRLPRALALEMIATGERLEAQRALALGLVNRIVPAGTACDAAISLAEAICANAPLAVRESLKIGRIAADHAEAEMWVRSDAARQRIQATEDYREGPRAFIEKRPPRWTGR
ncbi:enoyl-CoA hydratase [Rhizobiales bacterium GAS113]|jgi:enoyl-CoA hydratase/carnithine racemase|nr:enoyl-CoA hydratase [Rhizobiales bacterium GAS113]